MACDIEKTASGVIFRNPVAALIVVCLLLIAYLLSPGSWLPSLVGFVFCRGIRRPIADGIRYIFHNPSVIGYNSAHLARYQRHRATKGVGSRRHSKRPRSTLQKKPTRTVDRPQAGKNSAGWLAGLSCRSHPCRAERVKNAGTAETDEIRVVLAVAGLRNPCPDHSERHRERHNRIPIPARIETV